MLSSIRFYCFLLLILLLLSSSSSCAADVMVPVEKVLLCPRLIPPTIRIFSAVSVSKCPRNEVFSANSLRGSEFQPEIG